MKLALVTTSPAVRSNVGDYARSLLPHLREHFEVDVFVEPGAEAGELDGARMAPITELDPRACDRLLFQLGDEPELGFAPPVVRALGGTVMLHHWSLRELASAAYPALGRGGLQAFALALREGGLAQARALLAGRVPAGAGEAERDGRREVTLNRSIVRHADSFLVQSRRIGERIRDDRNAPTAVGLVPAAGEADWAEIARVVHTRVAGFPGPRTTRGARVAFGAWKASAGATAR